MTEQPNPPTPFPPREGGVSAELTPSPPTPAGEGLQTPPSLGGKGVGGLGQRRHRRRRWALGAAVVGLLAGFAVWYFAIRAPEPRNDFERFQGDWQISVAADGKTRPTQNVIRVSGDRWEYVAGQTVVKAYHLTLNEAANPKQIDLELLDTAGLRGAPVKMHGIYAFDGNTTARVLLGPASEPRPESLDDTDGGVQILTKVKFDEAAQPQR